MTAFGAGDCALDQNQLALGINTHHFQLLYGTLHRTQMTGHALTREYTTRILRLTDRTRHIMRTRVTVSGTVGRKVMALDNTRITLTLSSTGHINQLTGLKDFDTDSTTQLQGSNIGTQPDGIP